MSMNDKNAIQPAISVVSINALARAEQYVNALVQMQDTNSAERTFFDVLNMQEDEFNAFLADLRLKRCIVWDASDVQGELDEECPNLSDEDALRILVYAINHHGADTGVTWETFRAAAKGLGFPITGY